MKYDAGICESKPRSVSEIEGKRIISMGLTLLIVGAMFLTVPVSYNCTAKTASQPEETVPMSSTLLLNGYVFDFRKGEPPMPHSLMARQPDTGELGVYVVHCKGPILQEWVDALKTFRLEIVDYVHNFAYQVRMTPEQAQLVGELPFVDWVGNYHPAYKVSPDLDGLGVSVSFLGKEIPDSALQHVSSNFFSIIEEGCTGTGYLINGVLLSFMAMSEIAANPYVQYIAPLREVQMADEAGMQIVGGGLWMDDNDANHNTPYRECGLQGSKFNQVTGLSGFGVIVGIADTGLGNGAIGSAGHVDFGNRVIGGMTYSGSSWADGHGHGTHCAGLIAANGRTGTGTTYAGYGPYYVGMGLAYNANLYAQKIFSDSGSWIGPSDVGMILVDGYAGGARLHSNSWRYPSNGAYDTMDAAYDTRTRDAAPNTAGNQQILAIVAAGNDGATTNTVGSPGNSKNVLTIGASLNYMPDSSSYDNWYYVNSNNPDTIATFSSRGWTDDNRIKPDICAPGQTILSTRSPSVSSDNLHGFYSLDNRYQWSSGTSMATPTVAGGATVIYQWYQQKMGVVPSPAMMKALLINTAKDLGTADIPNQNEGWGRMYLTPISNNPNYFFMKDESSKLTTNTYHDYLVSYVDNSKPFKITLVWTDPAAATGANPALRNDLRLQVFAPGGQEYRGNAFRDGWTPANTNPLSTFDTNQDGNDNRNNVENVFIPSDSLQTGLYTVRVSGFNVPADCDGSGANDQDYALIIYNGQEDTTPPTSAITPSGAYWRNTSPIIITATASNGLSGVNNVKLYHRYRPHNDTSFGSWTPFGTDTAAPWSWNFNWPSGQGHYQFYTIATDNAGNVETAPASVDAGYGYDTTGPVPQGVPTEGSPDMGWGNGEYTVYWSPAIDAHNDVACYELQERVNGGNWQTLSASITTTNYQITGRNIDGNFYEYQIRAQDTLGNWDGWSGASNGIRIDTFAPETPSPFKWEEWDTSRPHFQWSAVIDSGGGVSGGSGVHGYEWKVDDGIIGFIPAPNTMVQTPSQPPGNHIFYVRAVDMAGNAGIWGTCAFFSRPGVEGYVHNLDYECAAISGASVTIYDSSNNAVASASTDAIGHYVIGAQPPGTYTLKATKSGWTLFSTGFVVEDVYDSDYILAGLRYNGGVGYICGHVREKLQINGWDWYDAGAYLSSSIYSATTDSNGNYILAVPTLPGGAMHRVRCSGDADQLSEPFYLDVFIAPGQTKYGYDFDLVPRPPSSGCPYVAYWNGSEYVNQNSILPASEDPQRANLDVSDYIVLSRELQPKDGAYSLVLKEFEFDTSKIDNVKIMTIDHASNNELGMTAAGELFFYSEPQPPVFCEDQSGNAQLEAISEIEDGEYFEGMEGDYLIMTFNMSDIGVDARLLLYGDKPPVIVPIPYYVEGMPYGPIVVYIMQDSGTWVKVSEVFPRALWGFDIVNLSPYLDASSEELTVKLYWEGWHALDFAGLDCTEQVDDLEIHIYDPVSAIHSDDGDVTQKLLAADQEYALLVNKDVIVLTFPYIAPVKPIRDVVMISNGHYILNYKILGGYNVGAAVEATITVTGKPGTTINVTLLENGMPIDRVTIYRDIGSPLIQRETISFVHYEQRQYEFVIDYCTLNKAGANPVNITYTGISGTITHQFIFKAKDGSEQRQNVVLTEILPEISGIIVMDSEIHATANSTLYFDIIEFNAPYTIDWVETLWDFGDGYKINATRPTVFHSYSEPGNYTITLSVKYETGEQIAVSKEVIIR